MFPIQVADDDVYIQIVDDDIYIQIVDDDDINKPIYFVSIRG